MIVEEVEIRWYLHTKDGWALPHEPNAKMGDGFVDMVSIAVIERDESMEEEYYIMHLKEPGSGGPIISGSTIDEVKSKFKEAFAVSLAVKSLMSFSKRNG